MIVLGLDDTDMPGTPGTNQLARALVRRLADRFDCARILRHQLLDDPRVPYTSKNGSASVALRPKGETPHEELLADVRAGMKEWYVEGSDPGLCVADLASVPPEVVEFGRTCQAEIVDQARARDLARAAGLHLEGLGGTEGGVIGALAAVGLAAGADDGRVVQLGPWPDDLSGPQPVELIRARDVDVRRLESGELIHDGSVDVGKHLRPNVRRGRVVLFVGPADYGPADWKAVKLT